MKSKLSTDMAFSLSFGGQPAVSKEGPPASCLRAEAMKVEVTGIYPHTDYLRLYVAVTAQVGVYLPCPTVATAR